MAITDMLTDFLNPKDAAGDASGYLDQIEGKMKPYYDKYINAGNSTLDDLMKQYSELMSDPGSVLSRLGKGYKESEGFKFRRDQGLNSINNAAAAGGMMGTMGHQQQAGDLSGKLASEDFGNYMRDALGLFGTGIQGKSHINDMGFDASTGFGRNLASILGAKANYAYEGAAAKNRSLTDLAGTAIAAATGGSWGKKT